MHSMNSFICLKKKLGMLLLISILAPVTAQTPFKLNPKNDLLFSASVLTIYGAAELYDTLSPAPSWDGQTYSSESLNSVDRFFLHSFDSTADQWSNATVGAAIALPVLAVILPLALQTADWKEPVTAAVLFAETILLTQTSANVLKTAVRRPRPYMYGTITAEQSSLDSGDWTRSFPSAHTATAFAAATAGSIIFCAYFPESNWKIPVCAGSFALAAATGVLRITSGSHFATDVIAGAVIGTLCGIAVPAAHRVSTRKTTITAQPLGLTICHTF
jgi:membrane-associated phospholipid phosphatase